MRALTRSASCAVVTVLVAYVVRVVVPEAGSSPRAWSRLAFFRVTRLMLRFISTCVEQTGAWCWAWRFATVHLHVRGADTAHSIRFVRASGSSPRAWSRRFSHLSLWRAWRFISTCVEQTVCEKTGTVYVSVHLHVRGADHFQTPLSAISNGSSPRAWSRRWKAHGRHGYWRFISTCVEQTHPRSSACR